VTTKVKPVPSGHNETLLPDTAPNCLTIFCVDDTVGGT
jgi:hypothetical protein